MCTVPAQIGVSLATSIIGAGMQQMAQDKANKETALYYNALADTSEEQADRVIDAADIQRKYLMTDTARKSKESRQKFKSFMGTQKTIIAKNNIGLGSRTAMSMALDAVNESTQEENLIRYNAEVTANEIFRNSEFQADQLKDKASQYRMAGRNVLSAGKTSRFANILGTETNILNTLVNYNRFR